MSGGYADFDNARAAIGDKGTGFVTFWDDRGLEVADLYPIVDQFRLLAATGGSVAVPVTCPSPHGRCKVTLTLSRHGAGALADGVINVTGGHTATAHLRLTSAALSLLGAQRHRLSGVLTVVVEPPGVAAHKSTGPVVIT
jgi:hypothetical protein